MTGEPRKFRVVKYARVSTDDQAAEDRFSIDAQISEMDEFIQRQGWVSVGEFIDRGISGTKRYRPQLDAMIAMAQRGGFDNIVRTCLYYEGGIQSLIEVIREFEGETKAVRSVTEFLNLTRSNADQVYQSLLEQLNQVEIGKHT